MFKNNNVVFIDSTQNYPKVFSAANTKVEFIAKGLIEQDDTITVINSLYGYRNVKKVESGKTKGITYYIFPRKGLLLWSYITNLSKFFQILKQVRTKDQRNFIFIDFAHYPFFLIDIFFSKILKYK